MDDKTSRMSPRPLGAGSQIDWYNIREVLGMSGLGITYRAYDGKLGREVAIREYLPTSYAVRHVKYSVQPISAAHEKRYLQGLSGFLKVARILEQFRHDNIIKVLNVIETNNTAYMAMECENGVSLDSIIQQCGTLEQNHQTQIFFPIFNGLQQFHELGFAHRSIKPTNIRIRENGSPVLLDFGSARQTSLHQPMESTALVNQDYMPLEQFSEIYGEQGPWTDIYSLAAIMYQGVMGTKPDEALSRSDHLLRSQPDTVQELSAESHPTYNQIFLSALHEGLILKPENRPQSLDHWELLFQGDLKAYRQQFADGSDLSTGDSRDQPIITSRELQTAAPVSETSHHNDIMEIPELDLPELDLPELDLPELEQSEAQQPEAEPMGVATDEPHDELDIALGTTLTEEEKLQRAGILAEQQENNDNGGKSLWLGLLLLAFIALAVGVMYWQTNSPDFASSNNVADADSSETTDQQAVANADGTPTIGAASDTPEANSTANLTTEPSTPEEPVQTQNETLPAVYFDKPLPNDPQSDNPRTFSQIVEAASPFPPFNGMDDKLWKDKDCSECHIWTRDSLCAQGEYYSSSDESNLTRIQHPFDGYLKLALKNWADNGCS